jgi:hypothetical protein
MKAIDAGVPVEDAPAWAVLERRLLELLGDAVAPTLAAYYDGGDLRWPADGGGLDDAYECFSNLPLVYALGGDEAALEAAIDHWEHVTERFARGGPGDAHVETVEEYYARQDWMHMGEGNQLFYHVCLAAPDDDRFRERAERFAELYLPDGPGNYDPERRMIVAPNAGSEGPGERTEPEAQPESPSWGYADWKEFYNLPFADVEGVETAADLRDEEKARRMGTAIAAGENAALLDGGDDVHFEMARSTIDALVEAGIEREDTLYVPFKHGEAGSFDYGSARNPQVLTDETGDVLWRDGWFEFRPMPARHPVHLVEATRAEEDIARLERLRNRAADASTTVDAGGKDAAGNEAAWAGYLAGEFPDYPERILQHCIAHAAEKLAVARDLPPEFVPGDDEFLNRDSPFDVEGLVHCTLGGSMPLYNGGLLRTRVRHFDPGRDRPGLPPDVAALVTDIGEGRTELELVNLAATDRAVIVQGGTYGEHVFGDVTYDAAAGDGQDRRVARVDGNALRVSLPGGTRTSLELETRRFAADPASAAPWDR